MGSALISHPLLWSGADLLELPAQGAAKDPVAMGAGGWGDACAHLGLQQRGCRVQAPARATLRARVLEPGVEGRGAHVLGSGGVAGAAGGPLFALAQPPACFIMARSPWRQC